MNKEKAKKIQRYYNYFRLTVLVVFIGLLFILINL